MLPLSIATIAVLLLLMLLVTSDTSRKTNHYKEKAYPMLRLLSFLLKLSAIAPVFFGFLAAFTGDGDSPGLLLLFVAAGCIAGLLLFTAGEVIRVLTELAESSRKTLEHLRSKDQA